MSSSQQWRVDIDLVEDDDETMARAVLVTGAGETLQGRGHARRNPDDTAVPQIGDEVAAARALRHLADRLLATASADIGEQQHAEVHLTH
jgi:hypothetical protein